NSLSTRVGGASDFFKWPNSALDNLRSFTSPNDNWTDSYPSRSFVLIVITRQGPASMTVTGVNLASSNIWVIPNFLPNNPFVIRQVPCQSLRLQLDFDIHAGG